VPGCLNKDSSIHITTGLVLFLFTDHVEREGVESVAGQCFRCFPTVLQVGLLIYYFHVRSIRDHRSVRSSMEMVLEMLGY
jgi:hypothetical protein